MTTALYRRYRPDTFAEVIGQEHVTEPLMQALRTGKVTHAYLFSGPRGCGKTTSARILARCLNCAEGPTATPCGHCESCVELARGGPGSLDVVEIDAASHGGVDDARDLRERATFAPARDRFKVFILDEAHMVTSQGFNALLKIVEEPPPHVKFVFATTEPDKVIGTIRSRTHHYPFRLVPPDVLTPYLEQVCAAEHVPVGPGVLPLVVRAGGGSVRDSMSVLDQLVAGADESGLDYERAVALLGFTHAALLDDVVDAVAVRDGASAFRVVDRVISSGHEPRRFVEDLLERLRDLIVIAASGEAARAVLRDVPADQYERMTSQAATLGAAELSRSADLVNDALTEMTGATSPRLHLELLVARLLLPAVDDGARGLAARLEKLERDVVGGVRDGFRAPVAGDGAPVVAQVRASVPPSGAPAARPPAAAPSTAPSPVPPGTDAAAGGAPSGPAAPVTDAPVAVGVPTAASGAAAVTERPGPAERAATDERATVPEPRATVPEQRATVDEPAAMPEQRATTEASAPAPVAPAALAAAAGPAPAPAAAAGPAPAPAAAAGPAPAPAAAGSSTTGGLDAETVRRRWPEVLQTLKGLRMATWVLVSQNAHVAELAEDRLTLAFTTPQLAGTFRTGNHADHVRRALHETLGLEVRIEPTIAGDAPAPAAPADADRGRPTAPDGATPAPGAPSSGGNRSSAAAGDERRRAISAAEAAASWDAPTVRRAATPAADAPGAGDGARTGGQATPSPGSKGGAPVLAAAAARVEEPPPPWDIPPPEEEPYPDGPPDTGARPAGRPVDRARGAAPDPTPGAGRSHTVAPAQQRDEAGPPGRFGGAAPPSAPTPRYDDGEDTDPDDPDIASTGLVGAPLIAQMLGGTVIDEIPEEG